MRTTIQCQRARIRPMCGPQRGGLDSNSKIDPKTPLSGLWLRPAVVLLILICLAYPGFADLGQPTEYRSTNTPLDIQDQGTMVSSITVTDVGQIGDLNVKVNITHGWNSDLDIFLIAPDGTRVELFTDVGGSSSNFRNTILDDEASKSIKDGSGPFVGSYRPEGSLASLIGKELSGTWRLEVTDDKTEDVGTLDSWSLIATIGVKEPLAAPVIASQASVPGGIHDVVSWDDLSEIREYGSTTVQPIPEQGTLTQTLAVNDVGMIEDLDVKVNISHQSDSELDVFLIAPDASRIELFTDVGDSGDHFVDTILDDQAPASIAAGTAPFTGRYRPEGSLSGLIGKDIHGQWKLEITDDSSNAAGRVNSWALMTNLADVLYYAQCATDAGFGTVVANSGWTASWSHTFTALDPQKKYWYRVKARPAKAWSQSSQADFTTDTLTATIANQDGDVDLAGGGGGLGPQLQVIKDPGFETGEGWQWGSNNLLLLLTGVGPVTSDLWVSDGRYAAAVLFSDDFTYNTGDVAYWRQLNVDWTGVATLVFDYCSILGGQLTPRILIGGTEVWSDPDTGEVRDERKDVKVDVSSFTGPKELKLQVTVDNGGRILAGIMWDKLRTYGPSSPSAGTAISTPITIGANDTWDVLTFGATTPAGTQLTVDILPETGTTPIPGYANILTGTDLSGLVTRTIRLRANLSTSTPGVTPELHFWSIGYSEAALESVWSNVASSQP